MSFSSLSYRISIPRNYYRGSPLVRVYFCYSWLTSPYTMSIQCFLYTNTILLMQKNIMIPFFIKQHGLCGTSLNPSCLIVLVSSFCQSSSDFRRLQSALLSLRIVLVLQYLSGIFINTSSSNIAFINALTALYQISSKLNLATMAIIIQNDLLASVVV